MKLTLWRIYDQTQLWAQTPNFDPLDGSGGLFSASRWNPKGCRMVYTASSAALVTLEALVHVPSSLFGERTLVKVEVNTSSIEEVSSTFFLQLFRDARDPDREEKTREFGAKWIAEGHSLLLKVPSIVILHDFNYLINPLHLEAKRLKIVGKERVRLDQRLLPKS